MSTTKQAANTQTQEPVVLVRTDDAKHVVTVPSESVTLLSWEVYLWHDGAVSCKGNSDGARCWQFYKNGSCKHTRRAQGAMQKKAIVGLHTPLVAEYRPRKRRAVKGNLLEVLASVA